MLFLIKMAGLFYPILNQSLFGAENLQSVYNISLFLNVLWLPMNDTKFLRIGIVFMLLFTNLLGKAQNIILPNAYAHNDYWHKRPLLDALEDGFTYVEADVYLRNNRLIVTHILPCLKKKKTLEELYLKPLQAYVKAQKANNIQGYPITLMIDIKSSADKTFGALQLMLEKYKSILSGYENGHVHLRDVTVVITGHKPNDLVNSTNDRLVFMDEDLRQTGADTSKNTYRTASCKYSQILKWKGKGEISAEEKCILAEYVSRAHQCGRKVRLWASPENTAVWNELLKCNVDLINTNKLVRLKNFLISENLLLAKAEVALSNN